MKVLLSVLYLVFITNTVFSQTQSSQTASGNFQRNFNANKYDEIFNSFSPEMKAALPLEKTRGFLTGLRIKGGSILSMEFMSYYQTYAQYYTKFEKDTMVISISLDAENQINGLYVRPFEAVGNTNSKTVNALSGYPKAIGDMIFAAAKDLPDNAQLSIAVTRNETTNYYGIKKANDTIKPADNQKKDFEIGSITKVFTSTILASLVEDKKIRLTDNINTYYPFSFKDTIKLTFLSLANHTSGLPRLPENLQPKEMTNPYRDYGKTEIEEYLRSVIKRENKLIPTYSYSNLGAGILGYSLGLSQKTTFRNLLQKRIFDKYKMTSSFTTSHNLGDNLIRGLDKQGAEVANWDFDALFSAGGILSTSADLVKFTSAQFDPKNKDLELTRRPTFTIKGDTKIGLGWHISSSANTEDLIWHNGGTGGYSSSVVMKVKAKIAVVVLSNVFEINDKIDALAYSLVASTDKK